ncbi:T9SS type A sorting domain-containing protein [Sporocytophaga myxococcoides]|uniref:Ig-like domain-containing protein n=1 Tax=Sporocytophaga myxococcoides TaxID=153721 RepID=UPI0004144A2F|nr:T9SS type A sorting domain-containing protein [Sporocytophaga myxococcoides]
MNKIIKGMLWSSILLTLFSYTYTKAQSPLILNSYAKVTAFPGCTPCFTPCNQVQVDNISNFNVGDNVLLIQMKGVDISWAQDSSFGTILTYGSAGLHEVLKISSVNLSLNIISFTTPMAGNYDVAGKVQLVKQFQSLTDYTVTSSGITCAAWDGDKGGVLFMEVNGKITLDGDIDVTGKGFRGAENPNSNIDTAVCGTGGPIGNVFANGIYFLDYSHRQWAGRKGEGIAEFRNPAYELGRGPLANGGGGGLNHNSGGGGGANMGYGGLGGNPYVGLSNSNCGVVANGMGGKVLDRMGGLRMYLGGGGGAGHENNNRGNSGGNGGGIIIIKATQIEGNGHKIISDGFIGFNYAGVNGGLGENDGGGGGGAGGSIKIDCNDFGSTALVLQARGGDGGSLTVTPENAHGPGGGGGGGLICFSASSMSNPLVTVVSTGGNAGTVNDLLTTSGALNGGNGITAYSCSSISSVPPSQIPFTLGTDQVLCSTPVVILDTKLDKSLYTFSWYFNGLLISGAKDPVYITNLPGKYAVKVTTPYCSSTDTIVIFKKGSEIPINQVFCASSGPVSVSLQIGNTDPAGNYEWYDSPIGGNVIGAGTTFTFPSLDKDTTLYVMDSNKITTVIGPDGSSSAQVYYVGNSSGTDITLQEHQRKFNVQNEMLLKSLEVWPALNSGGCGHNSTFTRSITITLYQNNAPTLQTATGIIQCGVKSKVDINFTIPPGNNYELRVDGISKGDLMMNDQHITYSIPDIMNIISNYSKSGVFFNWEIEYGSPCSRVPVWARQDCPLPVTITKFYGQQVNSINYLIWNTASEMDIKNYIVQRSQDGLVFKDIGIVAATGSSHYQFPDPNILSEGYYYRLKIIEQDQYESYSKIIYLKGMSDQLFSIFPNPARNELNLLITKESLGAYISIWDVTGKKILYTKVTQEQVLKPVILDITSLSAGVYFINCYSDFGSETLKLEIIK